MNVRTMIVGALALVCGLSAMVLVQVLRRPSTAPVVEKTPVVYVIADVKPGDTIEEAMLEVRQVPKGEAPDDAITRPADAAGRAAQAQLDKGDMVREKKLAERGAGRGMAALIRTGMRAFTIQTPSFSASLAGFLMPGNRVDVLLTATITGGLGEESGAMTTTLLQNVEILAVHTTVSTPTANKINPDDARSVTLLVTPAEVELLDLGQNKGTLHLSLRNLKDTGSPKTKSATVADLMHFAPRTKPAVAAAAAVAPAPPEPVTVQLSIRTMRGTAVGRDTLTYIRPDPATPVASSASIARAEVNRAAPAGAGRRGVD